MREYLWNAETEKCVILLQ